MRRTLLLIMTPVCFALQPATAQAQCRAGDSKCIDVDLRLISAAFGYGSGGISGLGATPNRTMQGLNVRLDVHILSLALRKLPFATYDALFLDLTYGKMSSDPLSYLSAAEDNSTMPFVFGYQFLAGIRRPTLALMGGLGYQSVSHDIGGTSMSLTATPITARAELGGRRKIVLMAWGGGGMLGGRVDVPLFRNLNATASYWKADGTAEPWDQPTGTQVPATATMLMLGFRTAEIR